MRHGKAEDARPGSGDEDRRLTKKGRDDIAAAGRWIALQEIRIDLIAASPLVRAQETAAIIADILGQQDRLDTWDVLAPGRDLDEVCSTIGRHRDTGAILLVGHEPQLSTLTSRIISGKENAAIVLSKGGLAKIRRFTYPMKPAGELHWLLTAKQMAGLK